MIIYIPIRGPEIINPGFQEVYYEYYRFLEDFYNFENNEDLRKLLDNEREYQNFKSITFSIIFSSQFKNQEDEEIMLIRKKFNFFTSEYISEFLKIQVQYIDQSDKNDFFSEITANQIISKISLLINLTYGTKIDFLQGILFSFNKKYLGKTEVLLSSLEYSYRDAIKVGWPSIKVLSLSDTLSWFKSNNLHTDDSSKNKLHRAINAFSYQFSKLAEKDTSILFWTMLGIESLLAHGNGNIMEQIKIKSTIILGHPVEYKKKLDKLYNYRSRFVHGDIDFPPKFSYDFENFEVEYWDNLYFATSILLALIRELILMNKNEFTFEYRLKL